jgi:hypothetical protein
MEAWVKETIVGPLSTRCQQYHGCMDEFAIVADDRMRTAVSTRII